MRNFSDQRADIASSVTVGKTLSRRPLNGAIAGRHEHVVRFLLDCGANINSATDHGKTPLHQASFFGLESIVELLIRNGAQLQLKTGPVAPYAEVQEPERPVLESIRDPTQRAVISTALTKYLLNKQCYLESRCFPTYDSPAPDHDYLPATWLYGGDWSEINTPTGWTALHDAAWNGHVGVIDLLLEHGADIECSTRYGWTALLFAVWNGYTNAVQALINRNATIDVRNVYGWTPLHAASIKGYEEIARLLLDHGADIEAETSYGWTPLYAAVPEERINTLTLLLRRGANIDANNSVAGTALHRAARAGKEEPVRTLLQYGANQSIEMLHGMTAVDEALFLGHKGIIHLFDPVPDRIVKELQDRVSQSLAQRIPLADQLVYLAKSDDDEPPSEGLTSRPRVESNGGLIIKDNT